LTQLVDRKIMPDHLASLISQLMEYKIQFTPTALRVTHPKFDDYTAYCVEEKQPFGSKTSVRVQIAERTCCLDDVKDDDSCFTSVSSCSRLPERESSNNRSSSIPKK